MPASRSRRRRAAYARAARGGLAPSDDGGKGGRRMAETLSGKDKTIRTEGWGGRCRPRSDRVRRAAGVHPPPARRAVHIVAGKKHGAERQGRRGGPHLRTWTGRRSGGSATGLATAASLRTQGTSGAVTRGPRSCGTSPRAQGAGCRMSRHATPTSPRAQGARDHPGERLRRSEGIPSGGGSETPEAAAGACRQSEWKGRRSRLAPKRPPRRPRRHGRRFPSSPSGRTKAVSINQLAPWQTLRI